MSPSTVQNEGFAQRPLLHQPDAHCEFVVQGLPLVGFGPSGLQTPPPEPFGAQSWLQQSVLTAHEALSATHCRLEHVPPTQEPVQHWFPVTHVVPGNEHNVDGAPHLPLVASQFAEQHSLLFAHVSAAALQVLVSARLASMIMSMKPSAASPASDDPPVSCEPFASLSPPSLLVVDSSPPSVESVMPGVFASATREYDVHHGNGTDQSESRKGSPAHTSSTWDGATRAHRMYCAASAFGSRKT
jgi:hypothetical protein